MASRHHDRIKGARWDAAREECFDRDGWACTKCGAEDDLQADHVVPLDLLFAEGYTPEAIEQALDVDNLATLCRRCNGRKGARVDALLARHPWVNPRWPVVSWLLDHTPTPARKRFFAEWCRKHLERTTRMTDATDTPAKFPTYAEMFEDYLADQRWITKAELPLVHHARRVAAMLDAAGLDAPAASQGAYLQAVERLNKRRPVTTVPVAGPQPLPGQTDILDFMDDE